MAYFLRKMIFAETQYKTHDGKFLAVVKAKQMELRMLYLVFLSKIIKKKPTFKLKILKSFIVCSSHWQIFQFQVSAPRLQTYHLNTKS